MIVLLRRDASQDEVEELLRRVAELELQATTLDGAKGRALEVSGPDLGRALALREASAVREILTRRTALVGGEPLWPHFALRLGIVALLLLVVLLLLAAMLPPGLGDRASPSEMPTDAALEWYLRPAGGLVALFPESLRVLAGVIGLVLWALFLFWPFVDRSRSHGARFAVRLLAIVVLAGLAALASGAPGP
jgi:hypothetical protein